MTTKRRKKRVKSEPGVLTRVVVVTRLSKAGHDEVSHETQEAGCRRKIEAMGAAVVAVYRDTISGDRIDRDGLQRAIDLIESDQADVLMTYSVDRLGRDQLQQSVIVYQVRQAGGDFLSATEDLAAGPLGDLMRTLHAFAAEVELAKTRERVNRALDARFAQKRRYKPAKRPPYGYARVDIGAEPTYVEEPTEADIVRRIYAEAAAGLSRRSIAAGLNRDGIPTPTGAGRWGLTTVVTILTRETYWTGQHEVWRSRIVRGEDGIPYVEERPQEERYHVPFPPLIDLALAERARAGAARNKWRSVRHDRTPAQGILRYGGAICGGCDRALSLIQPKVGNPRYACTHHRHDRRQCPAAVSITYGELDASIVAWVEEVALDPVRAASRWIEVEERPEADTALLARLASAEKTVADLTTRASTLAGNLSLVNGRVATVVAEQLNALNSELDEATTERDRLAVEATRSLTPARRELRRFSPETVIAKAVDEAIHAGRAASRRWLEGEWDYMANEDIAHFTELYGGDDQALAYAEREARNCVLLPPHDTVSGWHAWQAALATLGVTVTVNQVDPDVPRWVAKMRLPSGAIEGTCTRYPRC